MVFNNTKNRFEQPDVNGDNPLRIDGTSKIDGTERSAPELDLALQGGFVGSQTAMSGLLTIDGGDQTTLVTSSSSTTIDVLGGTGQIVNRDTVLFGTVTITDVTWPTRTNIAIGPLLPSTTGIFPIAIDINGDVAILDSGGPGLSIPQQWNYMQVGIITVTSGNIDTVQVAALPAYSAPLEVPVVGGVLGFANSKANPYTIEESAAEPATLKIKVNTGQAHAPLVAFAIDPRQPGIIISTTPTDPSPQVLYALRDATFLISGTDEIDPSQYESSPGTLASVGTNRFSVQKVFLFPVDNTIGVMYGTGDFVSLNLAIAAAATTLFPQQPILNTAIPIAFLAIEEGITDFTNPGTEFSFFDV